jgi:hypothetical protein
MEIFWCKSCEQSINGKVRPHQYVKSHQEKLKRKLVQEAERIHGILEFAKNVVKVEHGIQQKDFWCFCCEEKIDNAKNQFYW